MDANQIINLVNACFQKLSPYLGAQVVAELKSLSNGILPSLIQKWIQAGLAPQKIIDSLFQELETLLAGRPFAVFTLNTANMILDQLLPEIVAAILTTVAAPARTGEITVSFFPEEN
jgi:hypothetical protein